MINYPAEAISTQACLMPPRAMMSIEGISSRKVPLSWVLLGGSLCYASADFGELITYQGYSSQSCRLPGSRHFQPSTLPATEPRRILHAQSQYPGSSYRGVWIWPAHLPRPFLRRRVPLRYHCHSSCHAACGSSRGHGWERKDTRSRCHKWTSEPSETI